MVVDQDDGRGSDFERPLAHLARIGGGVVDRACGLALVAKQAVPVVQKQDVEFLHRTPAHPGAAIGDHRVVIVQHVAAHRAFAGELDAKRLGGLDERHGRLAHILHLEQRRGLGGKHAAERSEGVDQVLGKLLHIAPGIGAEQQQLQQLVVLHPDIAAQVFQEMPAQALPVALLLLPDALFLIRDGAVRRPGWRFRRKRAPAGPGRRPVTHRAACPIPSGTRSAPPPRPAPPRPCARTGPRATCPWSRPSSCPPGSSHGSARH